MTNAYVRIQRDGRWEDVEFDQLTDEELDAIRDRSMAAGASYASEEGWKWAKFLAAWIRDNVGEAGGA